MSDSVGVIRARRLLDGRFISNTFGFDLQTSKASVSSPEIMLVVDFEGAALPSLKVKRVKVVGSEALGETLGLGRKRQEEVAAAPEPEVRPEPAAKKPGRRAAKKA